MIEAGWYERAGEVWVAYTPDEVARLAHYTPQAPLALPVLGHAGGARVVLACCLVDAPGASCAFWGEDPVPGRVAAPHPGTLYVILDGPHRRALGLLPAARHPLTGERVSQFHLRVRGGGRVVFTLYDDLWRAARGKKCDEEVNRILRAQRAERAEAKRPGLSKVGIKWTAGER